MNMTSERIEQLFTEGRTRLKAATALQPGDWLLHENDAVEVLNHIEHQLVPAPLPQPIPAAVDRRPVVVTEGRSIEPLDPSNEHAVAPAEDPHIRHVPRRAEEL